MTPAVQLEQIGTTPVYIVEDHHHALLPWREVRQKLGTLPHVLTLDHHTDTLPAFTHYNEEHTPPHAIQCSVEDALDDLRHDEHFDFAIRNDLIRSAAIFSHVNFAKDVNPAIKIIHDPPENEDLDTLEAYYAQILETGFLRQNLARAPLPPDAPFILDIDLDCFKGIRSIQPADTSLFFELVRNAAAITICRERDWVRLLNLDHGKLQYEFFLENLLALIRKALTA